MEPITIVSGDRLLSVVMKKQSDTRNEEPHGTCLCEDACECIKVNTKIGMATGAILTALAPAMVGAIAVSPALLCGAPPKRTLGIGAAITGAIPAVIGAAVGGIVGFVGGLLCSPCAFFCGKPKIYERLNKLIDEKTHRKNL